MDGVGRSGGSLPHVGSPGRGGAGGGGGAGNGSKRGTKSAVAHTIGQNAYKALLSWGSPMRSKGRQNRTWPTKGRNGYISRVIWTVPNGSERKNLFLFIVRQRSLSCF